MLTLRNFASVAAASLMGVASMNASAALFSFSNEFSGSGDVCGNTTCGTLLVVDNGTGGVNFTLTANLASGEFITGLYGNRSPYAASAASNVGGTTDETGSVFATGENAFKADGDGFFDWVWDFTAAPPRLDGTETFTWTIASASLSDIVNAFSVDGPDGKNGFRFALRVQGLGTDNEGSGWFNSNGNGGGGGNGNGGGMPEPGTLALAGVALLAAALARRRQRA